MKKFLVTVFAYFMLINVGYVEEWKSSTLPFCFYEYRDESHRLIVAPPEYETTTLVMAINPKDTENIEKTIYVVIKKNTFENIYTPLFRMDRESGMILFEGVPEKFWKHLLAGEILEITWPIGEDVWYILQIPLTDMKNFHKENVDNGECEE